MEKAQELPLHIKVQEAKEAKSPESANVTHQSATPRPDMFLPVQEAKEAKSPEYANVSHQSPTPQFEYKWWLRMAIYTLFVLSGQSVATLLGRLYYDKGGKSKWMATLVQQAGFPILIPCLCISPPKSRTTNGIHTSEPSVLIIASIYVFIGLLLAAVCMLFSIGLLYLPVSTNSLICASQLAFNALFSFFINSQKFTPFIVNSLVLLTISSTLLVFQTDSGNTTGVSRGKYAIGFLCTIGASAGYALMLSLTQLAFHKVLKGETFTVVLEMIIYRSLVASSAILVGLFASGEWKDLKTEMEEYSLGKLSYVMTLIWIALSWKLFAVGAVGLIFEASSVFSNAISTMGLPVVPVFAVIFFHEKMDGLKVIALLLAIWGFVSYLYQQYLDDCKSKTKNENVHGVSEASPTVTL